MKTLGWNLDLLLRLWIKPVRLPFLLHQLAKTGQDKFAILFNLFVGQRAERIEEYSSCSFVGLGALVSFAKAIATSKGVLDQSMHPCESRRPTRLTST